ncbi:FAD-dependent monooxygenase [Nocardia sp. NBC_01499]|uniref:FAD-dependent oxidoreductase n=1 Tax=Nocardia sp. NBC_01499 TaxID=2903597 RepID=UPI0038649FB5
MSSPRIIIIGAGPAGLSLAQGLRTLDVGVDIYERDNALNSRMQGYRVHMEQQGVDALAEILPADLYELFLATAGVPLPERLMFDHHAVPISNTTILNEGVHLSVDRMTLREILTTGIEGSVHFGKAFASFEVTNDEVIVRFADGTSARCDILVAADGVNSPVRQQFLPQTDLVDTGLRQLYGKIPLTDSTRELFTDDMYTVMTLFVGPDKSFIGVAPHQPRGPVTDTAERIAPHGRLTQVDDYMVCTFGIHHRHLPWSDEELRAMSQSDLKRMTLRLIDSWHPMVKRIVRTWDADTLLLNFLRTSVPIEPWPTGPVTFMGDAIHTMSPVGGMGTSVALRDANLLTARIAEIIAGRPVLDALGDYEKEMTVYGFDAVRTTARNGQRLGQNPLPVA